MRLEPFTVYNGSRSMEVDCVPAGYGEGLNAEACSMPCAAKLLAEQAAALGAQFLIAADVLNDMLDESIKKAERMPIVPLGTTERTDFAPPFDRPPRPDLHI